MDALTLTPPLLAIIVAVLTRNVYAALLLALVLSETLLSSFNPGLGLTGAIDRTVGVFESAGNTNILLFSLIIGGLIALMRDSGGVQALAAAMIKGAVAKTRRRAELAVMGTGVAVFIETNVSLLSSGILGRPLYDAYRLSRQRLAYVIDSTSAPISVLILLNGWGAYALGLVQPYYGDEAIGVVIGSIGFNFYALATLVIVLITILWGRSIGPMATADANVTPAEEDPQEEEVGKARYMWLPLLLMVGGSLAFMTWTGGGNITEGDGSRSILYAICLAISVASIMLIAEKVFTGPQVQERLFSGMAEMVPLVAVLLFSIALGNSLRALGTGEYAASLAAETLPTALVPAILFLIAAGTSFMTGTSWGTFGILIPIAMPLAQALGIPPSLALAAVLGGGVFGDHCSPISDTTLIASVAAGTELIEHVKTQLPYALIGAAIAAVLYVVAGVVS